MGIDGNFDEIFVILVIIIARSFIERKQMGTRKKKIRKFKKF